MLKEYKSMTQEEMYTLVHEIYIEGCMENAREKYPDATDLTTAINRKRIPLSAFYRIFLLCRKILIMFWKKTICL